MRNNVDVLALRVELWQAPQRLRLGAVKEEELTVSANHGEVLVVLSTRKSLAAWLLSAREK